MRYERDDEDWQRHVATRNQRGNLGWFGLIFLGVFLGILAADGVKYLAVNAWLNYQLEQAAKQIRQASDQAARRESDRAAQARAAAERQAFDRKYNSNECKFWRDQHARNPSEKTMKGLAEQCP